MEQLVLFAIILTAVAFASIAFAKPQTKSATDVRRH